MKRPRQKPPSQRGSTLSPDEMISRIVGLQVTTFRRMEYDDDLIRSKVKAAIREALEGDKPWIKEIDDPSLEPPDRTFFTAAGMFRIFLAEFDIDRNDQFAQERWLRAVEQELDRALEAIA